MSISKSVADFYPQAVNFRCGKQLFQGFKALCEESAVFSSILICKKSLIFCKSVNKINFYRYCRFQKASQTFIRKRSISAAENSCFKGFLALYEESAVYSYSSICKKSLIFCKSVEKVNFYHYCRFQKASQTFIRKRSISAEENSCFKGFLALCKETAFIIDRLKYPPP